MKALRGKREWIYVNFSDNWRTDFSACVATGVSRAHPAWAASLLDLAGRDVRVPGWGERRNGPMINVGQPSQLEFIDAGSEIGVSPSGAVPR